FRISTLKTTFPYPSITEISIFLSFLISEMPFPMCHLKSYLHALRHFLPYDCANSIHKGAAINMQQSFEQFFKANGHRIHFEIHRLGIPTNLHDEFYTEGIVALWKAYQEMDASKGNPGTFLNYRIRFRLIDLIRKKKREEENEEAFMQHSNTEMTNGARHRHSNTPLVKIPDIPVSDAALWHNIRQQLTTNQWKWVYYFIIADLSIKEIMEIENVTADAVKGWGRSAKKKLRNETTRNAILDHLET